MPSKRAVPEGRSIDVLGVGTALIDHLSYAEASVLAVLELPVGAMQLVDSSRQAHIAAVIGDGQTMSGGTVANTAVGVASLGGHPAYIGAVGEDALGDRYAEDLAAAGVQAFLQRVGRDPAGGTGVCYVVVTPDAERTLATCLGVSGLLRSSLIPDGLVASAALVYLDGYLLDFPDADAITTRLVRECHEAGTWFVLGLADPFVVERHREALEVLIDQADLVFANEAEAIAMTGAVDAHAALGALSTRVANVVITRGPKGALLAADGEHLEVAAAAVEQVVDVTGAGDLFAAGVCYGLTHGLGLDAAALLGAGCAAEVIVHLGARPQRSLADLARALESGEDGLSR